MEWILVSLASLFAGFVDAIVGGGGLILLPALFATFPSAPPATLLGTNKSASIWGTAMATWQYSRRVQIRWQAMLPAALAGFIGAFAGAWAVTVLSPDFLRKLLPLVLLAVLAYTLAKKELGRHHVPRFAENAEWLAASLIGLFVGFYDGFFGPGAGSFYALAFVTLAGFNLAKSTAHAKVLNATSNVGGLLLFIIGGKVIWATGFVMMAGQFLGARAGSRLVLSKGQKLIRPMIVVVSAVMSAKLLYDSHGQEILTWLGMH